MTGLKPLLFLILFIALLMSPSVRAQETGTEEPSPASSPAPSAEAAPSPSPSVAPSPSPSPSVAPSPVVKESPAPTPAPAPVAESKAESSESSPRQLYLGPVVTLLSLPRPLTVGLEGKYTDYLGFSFDYGLMPSVKLSSTKLQIKGWDLRLKLYPFKGSFFIGVAYGTQQFIGSTSADIQGSPTTINLTQDNTFIAPHIGWIWGSGFGFFSGLDLGVQLSMSRKTTVTTDQTNPVITGSAEYQDQQKKITDVADLIGKKPLPMFGLLKFGFFF